MKLLFNRAIRDCVTVRLSGILTA